MNSEGYPTLYNECGDCASKNQKRHFQLIAIRITLLIAIAVIGSVAWRSLPQIGIYLPVATAAFIGILLIYTAVLDNNSCEKDWFVARAVSELIKRETWRYMMRVKPYSSYDANDNKDDSKFERFLLQIDNVENLPKEKLSIERNRIKISPEMKNIRNIASPEERKKLYVENRLVDQMNWYNNKSIINKKRQTQFNALMWSLLGAAVIIAILNVVYTNLLINAVGIATTTSAAALSWMSSKKFKELSRLYRNAADKLSNINGHAKATISNETELAKIVKCAEQVMSQEHNLWAIRRLPLTDSLPLGKVK